MERLARVFFQMHPRDADAAGSARREPLERAGGGERPLELRDLITLWQVGIEVVLPREDRSVVDVTPQGQPGAHGQIDGSSVQHRQHTGKTEAHRTDLAVGRRAERRAAAAEDFRNGPELGVNLQTDDRFVGHARGPAPATARVTCGSNVAKFSTNMRASLQACVS